MTAAVETMAYSGEVPWHGLGKPVNNDLTPAQMLKAAGLDWKVEKRPIYHKTKKGYEEVAGRHALVRDKDDRVLTVTGNTYKPVQNDVSMDFFRKFVQAGHMNMETAGSLHGGQYIWALARLGKDFTLGKTDEVRGFLLLSQPHVLGKAMVIQFTPIRVVCWNTLCFALGSNLKGKGANTFRMRHSVEFNDSVKKQAEVALGLASEQMDVFKACATMLTKKKAKPEKVEEFFCEVLQFDPKDLEKVKKNAKGNDAATREPQMLPKFRDALEFSPGANLATAKGTWWGALNAVTRVIDHEIGRDRSAALRTAWMGNKANVKRTAVDLAVQYANKA